MKNLLKIAIFSLFGVALGGCYQNKFPLIGGHAAGGAPSLTCDYGFYQRGSAGRGPLYPPNYQAAARDIWQYALLASNVYASTHNFKIPGWRKVDETSRFTGFFAELYQHSGRDEYAVVFRGTDQTLDWLTGNVDRRGVGQYRAALRAFDNVRAKAGDRPLSVVGHSLGGGLALYVSVSRPNVRAIVFNSSPRVADGAMIANNPRISISEAGDPLDELRRRDPEYAPLFDQGIFDQFNFVADERTLNNRGKNHSMYRLARGLLALAASSGDRLAIEVMHRNLGCPLPAAPEAVRPVAPRGFVEQIADIFEPVAEEAEDLEIDLNAALGDIPDLEYETRIFGSSSDPAAEAKTAPEAIMTEEAVPDVIMPNVIAPNVIAPNAAVSNSVLPDAIVRSTVPTTNSTATRTIDSTTRSDLAAPALAD